MKYEEIPDQQKRLCIECSNHGTDYEANYTEQKPVGIQMFQTMGRCWGPQKDFQWKWECLQCHEVQN